MRRRPLTLEPARSPGWRLAGTLALLSALGCAGESGELDPSARAPLCQSDADCAPGLACRLDYCSLERPQARQLEFTFLPSNASGYLPQRTGVLQVNPNDELAFELQPSLKVQGNIERTDDPQPLSGTLLFERSDDLSRDRIYTRQVSVQQREFQVELVPGLYDVTFIPESDTLPSRTWRGQRFELNSDFTRALPIPRTISGNVLHREPGAGADALPTFIQGARVVAVSRSSAALSTSATTDERGFFTLNVWPDSGVYDLVISPASATALLPRVVFERALDSSETTKTTLSLDLGEFSRQGQDLVLALPPSLHEALDFSPADLRVILRASLGKGTMQLSARFGQVGDLGQRAQLWTLALKLLPLDYEIELIPPASSRFARTTLRQDLRMATRAVELTLHEKRALRGRFMRLSPSGDLEAARGAEVLLHPAQDPEAKARSTEQAEPILAKLDDTGAFEAHVEARSYELELIPEPGQGLPRAFFSLSRAQIEAYQDSPLIWTLPSPVVLAGTVFDEQHRGQADVAIQVHEHTDGKRRLVAQGQTRRQGTFKLVLPEAAAP